MPALCRWFSHISKFYTILSKNLLHVLIVYGKFANGAAVAAVTDVSEVKEKVLTEDGVSEVEVSHQRVYLLGENRWEEPSRLAGRGKSEIQSGSGETVTKCTSCRGEGRLLCMGTLFPLISHLAITI